MVKLDLKLTGITCRPFKAVSKAVSTAVGATATVAKVAEGIGCVSCSVDIATAEGCTAVGLAETETRVDFKPSGATCKHPVNGKDCEDCLATEVG